MTLFIHAEFVQPSFHGLTSDGRPEWPPSPLRLAQTLMAGWGALGQPENLRPALDALVRLPTPLIHTPEAVSTVFPTLYTGHSGMVENTAARQLKKVFDLSHVGLAKINNVPKPVGGTAMEGTRVVYELADPEGLVDADALTAMAEAVHYFGRSRDLCDLWASTEAEVLPAVRWAPLTHRRGRSRGWNEHSTRWMGVTFRILAEGLDIPRPDPAYFQTPLDYARREEAGPALLRQGADDGHSTVQVFSLPRPVPSHEVPQAMSALAETGLTCFPTVFSGHPRATGAMYGVGVVLPSGASHDATLASVLLDAVPGLRLDAGQTMTRHTTDPRRWTSTSTRWVSATPLRAFPDERVLTYQLQKWAADVAHTSITELHLSRSPLEPWHHRWRQLSDGLDTWWIRLRLDAPVTGPVMVGASTDLGFGLLIPEDTRA